MGSPLRALSSATVSPVESSIAKANDRSPKHRQCLKEGLQVVFGRLDFWILMKFTFMKWHFNQNGRTAWP